MTTTPEASQIAWRSCASCSRPIGRAGRTNEELAAAFKAGTLATAIGATDYTLDPPVTRYFCWPCFNREINGR